MLKLFRDAGLRLFFDLIPTTDELSENVNANEEMHLMPLNVAEK